MPHHSYCGDGMPFHPHYRRHYAISRLFTGHFATYVYHFIPADGYLMIICAAFDDAF